MKSLRFLLILIFIALPLVASAEYKSINELARLTAMRHASSATQRYMMSGSHPIIPSPLSIPSGDSKLHCKRPRQEWNKPVNREHMMRCMGCHAPLLKDASEPLIKQISDLIVAAVDEKDEAKKESAKKELAKLNVNCITCHNTKAVVEKNLKGAPQKDVYYSPAGKKTPAHKTEKSPAMERPLFCGQCHAPTRLLTVML